MKFLVIDAASFIGSCLVRMESGSSYEVINFEVITYASSLEYVAPVADAAAYHFQNDDISGAEATSEIFQTHQQDQIIPLAAESHFGRLIDGPRNFHETNIIGTFTLLQAVHNYVDSSQDQRQAEFCFHHASTDQVYGDLSADEFASFGMTPFALFSPYSASKAASEHFLHGWLRTYGSPVISSLRIKS